MSRLAILFDVEPGEGRLVSSLFLLSFLMGTANNLVQTTAFALFMVEFDARTLAVVYIANALVIPLLTLGYLRLGQRLSFSRTLIVNLGFLLLTICVFRLGIAALASRGTARWLMFALPILFQVVVNFGNLAFWTLAGRLFDVRQGKRLFGLVGAGLWLAIVITGVLIPLLVTWLGTPNLLLLSAGAVAGALALVRHITRSFAHRLAAPAQTSTTLDTAPAGLLRNRYVILLLALTVLWWLGYSLLDNVFYAQAAVQYPDEVQLASFLGIFLAALGVLTLLGNTLLAGPVINHYGVRGGVLLLPGALIAGVGAMAAAGIVGETVAFLFWLATLAKLLDMALGFSVDRSALTILYQPLPADQRGRAQTVAEGVFQPLANGLAGVILLTLSALRAFDARPTIYVLLLIVAVWLVVAVLLGRQYPAMLVQALAKRRLGDVELSLTDRSSRSVLQKELGNPHPGVVVYVVNTLEAIGHESLPAVLQDLLAHPAPEVRQDALQRIERLGVTSALAAVRRRVATEVDPSVRGTAVRTFATLGEAPVFEEVSAFLDDPDPLVRRGALVGLLRSGGIAGVLVAGHRLLQMARSTEPAERAEAAQVLGEVGVGSFYQPLVSLLQDEDTRVQRAALRAAGQIGNAKLWPLVLEKLSTPGLRRVAAAALVAGGEPVLDDLTVLARAGQPREIQAQLAQIGGRIGGEKALDWLKEQLAYPDAGVRTQVLHGLSRCGYRVQEAETDRVRAQVEAEAAWSAEAQAALAGVGDDETVALLREALHEALARSRERTLLLLSFLYDRDAVLQARDVLCTPRASDEERAYALETVDVLVAPELKRACLPLLSARPTRQPVGPGAPGDRLQRLREIVASPPARFDTWTRSCALYAIHRLSATAWSELVANGQEEIMLSTIEKVIALKQASIFAETPGENLVQVAACLEEVRLRAGETVFEKGEQGDCMYIVVDGRARVHDGDRTLNRLQAGDVFGEMAVLDAEPRMASVTAEEDTLLLRLAQEPLYEVLDDRGEIARGIIRVLSQRLRAQN